MMSIFSRFGSWLSEPLIEHLEGDRPFRLRRASALMLAIGWAGFAIACVLAMVMLQVLTGALFMAGLMSVYWFDRRDDAGRSPRRGI
jgi:hypothetical protein